jgi:flagellar basal body-associated protein FliL
MSEKSDHKSDGPPAGGDKGAAGAAAGKKGGLLAKTPVLLGGVMVLEAVLLLAGFKFLGGGARSASAGAVLTTTEGEAGEHAGTSQGGHGEGGGGGEHGATEGEHGGGGGSSGKSASKKSVELKVVEFRAPNKQTGKTIIYDVAVYAVVKGDKADAAKRTIEDRSALIQDRVRTIMARNDPERLGGGSEPGLETLRRQVKHELDEIMGDGMVEEVLIPRCIPFGPGY